MSIRRCWQAQHCPPFCRLQTPITLVPVLKANTCVTGPLHKASQPTALKVLSRMIWVYLWPLTGLPLPWRSASKGNHQKEPDGGHDPRLQRWALRWYLFCGWVIQLDLLLLLWSSHENEDPVFWEEPTRNKKNPKDPECRDVIKGRPGNLT